MFGNLTWMQLAGFDKNGWELLPQLLESAPNLEWLEITEVHCSLVSYSSFHLFHWSSLA